MLNETSFKHITLHNILVFLLACIGFSIPFGGPYTKEILILTIIIWLFCIKKDDILNVFKNKFVILLILYILVHLFSLIFSQNIEDGFKTIFKFLRYSFIPIILIATILKHEDIKYVLFGFVFGMFINEIISYLIYFDIYYTEFSKANGYPVGFINHIFYSVFVAFCAILILYQSFNIKNKYLKTVYILFFITMTINLVISGGRTGYVAFFATLVFLLFTYYKFSLKNFLKVLLFPTIVFYVGYTFNEDVQARAKASVTDVRHILDSQNYDTSFGARLAAYPIALDILKQEHNSFIFGVGAGDFHQEFEDAKKRTQILNIAFNHLHNIYLTTYVNAGILALILLILMAIYLLKLKIKDKEISFIRYVFVNVFFVSGLSDNILTDRITEIFFIFFVGIILNQYLNEQKESVYK